MEDEDIAPNTIYAADPVCTAGRKSCQYNYIPVQEYSCTGATICSYRLAQYPRLPVCVLIYI